MFVIVQNLKQMQVSEYRWASSLSLSTHTHTLSSLACALTNQANNSGFHNRTIRGGNEGVWDEGQRVCVKCVLYFSVISGYFKGSCWRAASCTWSRRGCQINVHTYMCTCHTYIILCTYIHIHMYMDRHWEHMCTQLAPDMADDRQN